VRCRSYLDPGDWMVRALDKDGLNSVITRETTNRTVKRVVADASRFEPLPNLPTSSQRSNKLKVKIEQQMKPFILSLCLAAIAVPASARNAEDFWCGKPRIHLMMWIAKVQEPDRDDEGKLIRDNEGNLVWGRAADGRTYSQYGIINHKLPENHPKWVTVVPERWIRFDTDHNNIYFRGQKCTVFTEEDQDKYGVGYFGPRYDLRYPYIKGKIPEVIKPVEPRVSEPSTTR
jgi:hypothetical protein